MIKYNLNKDKRKREYVMNIIFGLLLGALAGFIGSLIMNEKSGWLKNIILGIAGGFVGSSVFRLLGLTATGQFGGLITAVVGACICIWIGRKLF